MIFAMVVYPPNGFTVLNLTWGEAWPPTVSCRLSLSLPEC